MIHMNNNLEKFKMTLSDWLKSIGLILIPIFISLILVLFLNGLWVRNHAEAYREFRSTHHYHGKTLYPNELPESNTGCSVCKSLKRLKN